ncbi:hypothetical protein LPN04_07605 [Rugamonas sp. A1-17]|nr:hypothetical protein [Rugamonas sp. A1-17]
MRIEISFLWMLVNPKYALMVGLTIILGVALVAYLLTRNRPQARRWQALLSEVLVSVGVIGLLTFAARAHIESEIRHDASQVEENKRLARVASMDLLKMNCLPEQSAFRPTPEMENIWVACDIAFRIIENDEDVMRYWAAHDRLKDMSKPTNPNRGDSARIDALKAAVNDVIESNTVVDHNLHRKTLVESEVSWLLISICAVSAMFGIGLKWAKAIFEFRKAAAS